MAMSLKAPACPTYLDMHIVGAERRRQRVLSLVEIAKEGVYDTEGMTGDEFRDLVQILSEPIIQAVQALPTDHPHFTANCLLIIGLKPFKDILSIATRFGLLMAGYEPDGVRPGSLASRFQFQNDGYRGFYRGSPFAYFQTVAGPRFGPDEPSFTFRGAVVWYCSLRMGWLGIKILFKEWAARR